MKIHSVSIRTIPIHSDICIWANVNNSELIRKTFCISFDEKGQKSIRINPINVGTSFRMNPNQSETKFLIQINLNHSDLGLIQTEFSININANHSDLGFIRIDLDWKLGFGLGRIHSVWCLRINRIKSDWFLTVFH